MEKKKFVVMGAGEVGRFLARSLSADGHDITLIDRDEAKQTIVEEQLDVGFVHGDGSHIPTLVAAGVADCDLLVAASSSDEANLVVSLLGKNLGAQRTVVRVHTSEDITQFGRTYERLFEADLLLSTQLLTTTRILNHVLGYNTLEIEYVAGGALQIRRTAIEAGSILAEHPLSEARLPAGCLVLALISDGAIKVPTGADRAQVGDDALVIGTPAVIDEFERTISRNAERRMLVAIAGGGKTAEAVIENVGSQVSRIKVIEHDRRRAEELSARYPRLDVVNADATDASALASEGLGRAEAFIALTGNDDTNLMACLLAQELGVRNLTALVQKSETSSLWRKVAMVDVVSPRTIAAERIRNYIDAGYEAHIVSFENGAAKFVQRHVYAQSPVAGERLSDIQLPEGLIVAAVLRDDHAIIPTGRDELRPGDTVILFVLESELGTSLLLFPGPDAD